MRPTRLFPSLAGNRLSPTNFQWLMRSVLLFAGITALAGSMMAQQTVTVNGVPPAVQNGKAALLGHYNNPQQMLRLVITLQPPHPAEEEQFLRQLQDPASPSFHQYLSQSEWNQRFAPSAQDEQAVVTWAQSQGLSVTQRYANRLLVAVEAPVAVIEKAFAVTINSYQVGDSTYFSNDREPSIPAALGNVIHSVMGMNNIQVMHSRHSSKRQAPVYSPGPSSQLGPHIQTDGDPRQLDAAMAASGKKVKQFYSNGAYDPSDIYSSYAYNYIALQGLGHCCNPLNNPGNSPVVSTIAIAIGGDFLTSDIQTFAQTYGLATNVQKVLINGATQCSGQDCDAEATLDTEWSTAMANSFGSSSKTAEVYVYEGPDYGLSTLLDVIERALEDGHARVLNMSWGLDERDTGSGYLQDYHNVFNDMVAQGWTLVAASGDGGATADCATDSVSAPATDPDVTAVGGNTLQTGQGGYSSEVAWSGGPYGCEQNDGGSGGGCSIHWTTTYQGTAACANSYRSVPDVALNADWVNSPQNLYFVGNWYQEGGTSIAAPEMTGFFAQENAYLLYIGNIVGNTCGQHDSGACSPLGASSTYFYDEGLHSFAPHYPFYDITSGCNNNDITEQNGLNYFCAGVGYDRVTGFGSANMLQLAWMINYYMAGDGEGPSLALSGPPVHQWYRTAQTVNWTMTDRSGNGHHPNGPSGASLAWDADPGDPARETTPGSGSSYYGPQYYGASGSAGGLSQPQGCHTAYVRAWDNAGNSALGTPYGPLCFDNVPPVTTITLTGNGQNGNYNGPVLVSVSATDNASGVAATYSAIDNGTLQPYAGPVYVWLPGNHTVTAYSVDVAGNIESHVISAFDIQQNSQFAVTVAKPGNGSGTVTSTDGQINCGSTCTGSYYDEQPITLNATAASGSVFIGWQNCDQSFGLSCTLTVTAARTVTAIFNLPQPLQFTSLTPCRVVDTRQDDSFSGPTLQGGTSRSWAIPNGPCPGIPTNASAYSLNITAIPHGTLNYLTAWPTGLTQPLISTLNSYDGRVKANAAILPAGSGEAVSVYVTDTSDILLDIDGYFVPTTSSTLAFFSLTPCRVVDTRNTNGPLGGPILTNEQVRTFPVLQSSCNIPSTAQAYSFNYTVIPQDGAPLGYLTTWPYGQQQPVVSTLNDYTGTVVANAALVPAGQGGQVSVYPYGNNTHLIIDVNGYFAPASSGQNPLSLYVFAPCRVLDTRQGSGQFHNQIVIPVLNSPCEVPSTAKGYVFNATVVPNGPLYYLSLWPDGEGQPLVSTLNAQDGAVTSNMAIVPNLDGSVDAWAQGYTQLILDISSYFAP
jgi:xanthomonalisin